MTANRFLEKSGIFFFILLALAIFVSKSFIDILYGCLMLLAICSLATRTGRGRIRQSPPVLILLVPLLAGFLMSFFSLSGPYKGTLGFLEQYRFFLLLLPFALFITSQRILTALFWALNISAFASVVWGVIHNDFTMSWGATIGLYPIGRASDLLISMGTINLTYLLAYPVKKNAGNIWLRILVVLNTLLLLTAVLFMYRRGSYFGFIAGGVALLLTLKRYKILLLIIAALCASIYFSDLSAIQRVRSTLDFKGDHSNRERIQLLRTGSAYLIDAHLFFRGTGAKMAVEPFTEYFYSHDTKYQEENKDIVKMQMFGNFHNSFLQMAVEYGIFFVLIYLASIGYTMVYFHRRLPPMSPETRSAAIAAIVLTSGFFVSQFFHNDLYSYGGLPFILTLAAGCQAVTGHFGTGFRAGAGNTAPAIAGE
jgi:hypothetical protein